ncbi:hypothetical protein QUB05_22685 [Microcoleus sp. F10-C6]
MPTTIAWHLQQALKLKHPQRVVYSQITPAAVQAAVANPRSIDMHLVGRLGCVGIAWTNHWVQLLFI